MADRDPTFDTLVSMDETNDFEVHEGEPDPRGWDVRSADGRTIGEVDDMIVDTSAMKVRYLVCDLDEDELDLEDRDRHILIPIGYAMLDEDDQIVEVSRISVSDLSNLPAYTGIASVRDIDTAFTTSPAGTTSGLGGTTAASTSAGTAGQTDIDRRVESRGLESSRPVTGMSAAGTPTESEQIREPLTGEGAGETRRAGGREEIPVRRRGIGETDVARGDLGTEDRDVNREDRGRLGGS